jgi:hypothetical protein
MGLLPLLLLSALVAAGSIAIDRRFIRKGHE